MEPKISATGRRVLMRFDHVASIIVDANHSIVVTGCKLCVADCVAAQVWINAGHGTPTLISVAGMNRSIFYIIGVIVVIVIVLKVLGLF
jgi:hypothetical protein